MQKNQVGSSKKSLSQPSPKVDTKNSLTTTQPENHIGILQKTQFAPKLLNPADIQVLQRTIGNQATQRVLTTYMQRQSEANLTSTMHRVRDNSHHEDLLQEDNSIHQAPSISQPQQTSIRLAALPPLSKNIVARAVSPHYPTIKKKLSYGIFDWAITDREARDVLKYLSALSPTDLNDTVSQMKRDGFADRLLDNIADSDRSAYAPVIRAIQHPVVSPSASSAPPATQEEKLKAKITELNKIINDPNQSFGEIAKAITVREDLLHDLAIEQRGYGKYKGSQSTDSRTVTETSCIQYIMAVLGETFEKKGQRTQWEKIRRIAVRNHLKGTVLLQTIQSHLGWKGVFWAPDTKNPEDKESEHPYAASIAKRRGKYYGIKVERDKSVINYRPTNKTQKPVEGNLNKLKKVPFGLLIARGGKHTALIVEGTIYEVHWDIDSTSQNVIEASSFENWAWLSGMILMPPEDMKSVW